MAASCTPFSSKGGQCLRARSSLQPAVCRATLAARPLQEALPQQQITQQAQLLVLVNNTWRSTKVAKEYERQALKQQLVQCSAVGLLPLASLSMGSSNEIYGALAKGCEIYEIILTVRILASWFKVNWYREPFNTLKQPNKLGGTPQITDPFLNLFRGIIPPLGGIDLSPMIGFMLLSFAGRTLKRMALTA